MNQGYLTWKRMFFRTLVSLSSESQHLLGTQYVLGTVLHFLSKILIGANYRSGNRSTGK